MKPIVWTIAGSDSGGGAGIQADIKTMHTLGVHPCSVITAVTAQNSEMVTGIFCLSGTEIETQLQTLASDLSPAAIKIGMLANTEIIHAVGDFLKNYKGFVICDPVMVSTSGSELLTTDAKEALIKNIFPYVDIITPNQREAAALLNQKLNTLFDLEAAGLALLKLGAKQCLITGGDAESAIARDLFCNQNECYGLETEKINALHTHGAGCSLSSAIASCVALGHNLKDAIVIAKMYVTQGVRAAKPIGGGPGPVAHLQWPNQFIDLPRIREKEMDYPSQSFLPMREKIGLYPIIDRSHWLEKLLPLGIKTIQLRIKDLAGAALANEIARAVKISQQFNTQLFINDYWELALQHGAFGVHLGQEDIVTADFHALQKAGLRLGISTHCYHEVARAHAIKPSYIAVGPIFPTTSKPMAFGAQGIERLRYWQELLNYPLVAIGGINRDNLQSIVDMGVNGVALISAITKADDPIGEAKIMLKLFNNSKK